MNTRTIPILAALVAATLTVPAAGPATAQEQTMNMMMGAMDMSDVPRIPPVAGYAEGQRIFFLHTETSDLEIAQLLAGMMGSPVLVVPALADAPEPLLTNVYVFANGVKPDGPRGPLEFQPDVFDNPPGATGYTPLRRIILVTWRDNSTPRVLKSSAEVEAALAAGEIAVEEPGVVVNMPFITWPGGQR